jgi:CRISPR-associated protein Csb2
MAPVDIVQEIQAFSIESGLRPAPAPILTKALRRAVIARVQMTLGDRQTLSPFFTGHHDDGSPARTEQNPHLAFAFDAPRHRLFIVAPHLLERRPPSRQEVMDLRLLDSAMERFCELLAGGAGKLILRPAVVDFDRDRLLASANAWESVTPYQVTRHAKREDAAAALAADVLSECHRRGLPTPRIAVLRVEVMPGLGICGWLRLDFQTALQGPVLLGRTRHLGGGLFQAVSSESRRAATP